MPESWTARGAVGLTLIFLVVTMLAYLSAPTTDADPRLEWVDLIEIRAAYHTAWYAQTIQGLAILATLWGAYGARHLVPTPPGWGRPVITTAELRRSERLAATPTPTELGDV